MIHVNGCLGVEMFRDFKTFFSTKTETKSCYHPGIFFAPAKTVLLLKSTVFAAQAVACDDGVSPAMCVRG